MGQANQYVDIPLRVGYLPPVEKNLLKLWRKYKKRKGGDFLVVDALADNGEDFLPL